MLECNSFRPFQLSWTTSVLSASGAFQSCCIRVPVFVTCVQDMITKQRPAAVRIAFRDGLQIR